MNNFSLKNRFFQLKQAVSLSSGLTRLSKIGASSLMFAGAIVSPALADPSGGGNPPPPPPPQFPAIPTVFCFRFTDIKQSTTDPEKNRFEFEFESLNWSNQPTYEVKIAFNEATKGKKNQAPVLDGAGVDSNGRPIGSVSARPPGNQDIENDWTVKSLASDPSDPSKKTAVSWKAGTPISNIDLIGIQNSLLGKTTQDLVNRVNQDFNFNPDYNPSDTETIDNGPNVRDGFVFALDDFDEGEVASFNWFLRDKDGNDIGQPNQGNAYGFGSINLTRIKPGSVLPGGAIKGNTGFSQAANLFYDDIFRVKDQDGKIVAEFGTEFAPGIIAAFLVPADNDKGISSKLFAKPVPEPMTIFGTFAAFGFGAYFKRTGSKKDKLLNGESDS